MPKLWRRVAVNGIDTSDAESPRWSEDRMPTDKVMKRSFPRILTGVLLGAVVCGALTACSTVPHPPTYTQAELRAMCERRGGWWRGSLIPDYCEYQAAFLREAP